MPKYGVPLPIKDWPNNNNIWQAISDDAGRAIFNMDFCKSNLYSNTPSIKLQLIKAIISFRRVGKLVGALNAIKYGSPNMVDPIKV